MQLKSYMPGYYSMRDLNEDLNGCSNWPLHYRERCLPNGQVYSHSLAGADAGSCFDYDKDAVKQKMLEHEAIFKKQVLTCFKYEPDLIKLKSVCLYGSCELLFF